MSTGQKHSFLAHLEVCDAHRASWLLQVAILTLFAMLLLDGDNRQSLEHPLIRRPPLALLLLLSGLPHVLVDQLGEAFEAHKSTSILLLLLLLLLLGRPREEALTGSTASVAEAAPEVLVVVHSEFLRVKTLLLCH